jgi:hypothetical protein
MALNSLIHQRVRAAVRFFWETRDRQMADQGSKGGTKDAGSRKAVTGGAQMDGFVHLIQELLRENGLPHTDIFHKRSTIEIPGWFRPEKQWDLIVVRDGKLLVAVELKSQVGSFGNNYNNRTEEAIGSATDLWAAFREGAFRPSPRPWVGYLMLLQQAPGSMKPVKPVEPHFEVFLEFKEASYARRYELLLTKLVRERLYDAACFLMSDSQRGALGEYTEPAPELSSENFATSLIARALAAAKATD